MCAMLPRGQQFARQHVQPPLAKVSVLFAYFRIGCLPRRKTRRPAIRTLELCFLNQMLQLIQNEQGHLREAKATEIAEKKTQHGWHQFSQLVCLPGALEE